MRAVIFASLSTTTLRAQYWNCSALCRPCDLLNGNVINKRTMIAIHSTKCDAWKTPKANDKSLWLWQWQCIACRSGWFCWVSFFLLVHILHPADTSMYEKAICLVFFFLALFSFESKLSVFAWTHLICSSYESFIRILLFGENTQMSQSVMDFLSISLTFPLIMWICRRWRNKPEKKQRVAPTITDKNKTQIHQKPNVRNHATYFSNHTASEMKWNFVRKTPVAPSKTNGKCQDFICIIYTQRWKMRPLLPTINQWIFISWLLYFTIHVFIQQFGAPLSVCAWRVSSWEVAFHRM